MFGKESLYDKQSLAVEALVLGKDVLMHLPTSFGKTLVGWALIALLDILLNGVAPDRVIVAASFFPVVVFLSLMKQLVAD